MKFIATALCTTLFLSNTIAQDKLPAFGKIDKADLEMKICDFDPDSEALYLMDVGEVQIMENLSSWNVQTDRRVRIKILKEKGIQEADVKIYYYSKDRYEDISDLSGMVYNLDDAGNIVTTKLEKSLIFDKKADANYSVISFAFPNVKVGTVVEYKYRSFKKSGNVSIDDWTFQSNMAVRYSAYNLLIPSYFDFTYQLTRRQPVEVTTPQNDREGTWYIMRNIPALRNEPFHAGLKDYYQRIDFQLAGYNPPSGRSQSFRTTWEKLTEELLEAEWFGQQIGKNLSGLNEINILTKLAKTPKEKIELIYKFVQKNMDWNGDNSRGSDGIKQAWDKKSGTSGDINLILLTILKDAGIKAYPMLISTRENGKVNTTYPLLSQFDATYVYAEADGTAYVLDASDKYNPPHLIPYDVQLTEGFVVDKKAGGFISINDYNRKLKQTTAIHIEVDEKGEVKGEALINSFEYARNISTKNYKNGKLKELLTAQEGITLKIDSIEVKNLANDSLPFEQKLSFSGTLQSSGDYTFIPYNLFNKFGKNPFVAEKRQTDVDFGFNQYYTIMGGYNLADNYEFEELPKNMTMIMPDTSIVLTRIMQKDESTLSFRITLDFRRPQYSAEEYPDVKEYYKKMAAMLNEQIVIKKKKK
jgi:Domain of Unknown Function with PDB structure (DUF3857)/Transglutaminase-like superfamily